MNKTSANKMKKTYINTATKTHSSVHLVLNRVLSFTFPVFTISNVLFHLLLQTLVIIISINQNSLI